MAMGTEPGVTAEAVLEALTRVVVPGFGINPVDLGLIYGVEVDGHDVRLTMTLPDTAPEVPVNFRLAMEQVIRRRHPDVGQIAFDLVWDPPWREDFITAEGLLQQVAPLDGFDDGDLSVERLEASLESVIDPELGINIVDLGLVRSVQLSDTRATVVMTLTTPGCPLHSSIEGAVQRVLETCHPGLDGVSVELVWDPPWSTSDITPEGRAALAAQRHW